MFGFLFSVNVNLWIKNCNHGLWSKSRLIETCKYCHLLCSCTKCKHNTTNESKDMSLSVSYDPLADLDLQLWKRGWYPSTLVSSWWSWHRRVSVTCGKEWWLTVREAASTPPPQGFRCMGIGVTAEDCEWFLAKFLCFSCWSKKMKSCLWGT